MEAFRRLLEHASLHEQKEILPFFRGHPQLAAFMGLCHGNMGCPNRLEFEYPLFDGLRADLVVGEWNTGTWLLVEFENAVPGSLFKGTDRCLPAWSARFERGFSQLVDWLWQLDDARRTVRLEEALGRREIRPLPLLVIGRDLELKSAQEARFHWRSERTQVDSKRIELTTYDQLFSAMDRRLKLLGY